MTMEEFLAFEEGSAERHELINGEVFLKDADRDVAMAGARQVHEDIAMNLATDLHVHLRGKRCKVHKGDTLVRVTEGAAFYPDLVVFCDPRDVGPDKRAVLHPSLLVEILSPSTADWDRSGKFDFYRELTSLREYLVLHSEQRAADLYARQADGSWRLSRHLPGELVPLASVDLELPVDAIYEDVAMPETSAAPTPPGSAKG